MYGLKRLIELKDGRSELYQWDTGVELSVGEELSQVHMSINLYETSKDIEVVDGTVKIPDVLLQESGELDIWGFVGTLGEGHTKIHRKIKINRRSKPADYLFTPPEQTTLQKLTERLDEIDEKIKGAGSGFIAQETDPTIPAWAKASEKPTYTAQEVGALPDTAVIDNESQITDDTLIVIDPDATPDKIPEWYNGTAITGVGSNILVAINGSASGDYYLNTNNGNVYKASAPNTWDYIGCLKGNDGSDSIYIGTEEEAANSSGATIWINPTTVTDEDYVTTLEISSLIKALGIGTVTYDEANEGYSMRIGDILIRTGMVHLTFPKADEAVTKTVSFTGDIFEAPDSSINPSVQISPTVILVPWTTVPRYFSSSANPIISDGKVSAIKLVASRTAAFTSTVAFKWLAIGKLYKEV